MIAAPEYNNGISGVLKNMIDWVSRPLPNVPRYDSFLHKQVVLMSASGTQFGGVRGLMMLKVTLSAVSMIVLPNQVMIPRADQAFDEHDKLKDPKLDEQVQKLSSVIVKYATLLKNQG
jgi:NAD(P)H-dependent FMN reductase